MNVSAIDLNDKKWYKYMSPKRIEKLERLRKDNKKAQSIGAELLLNYSVNGDMKIPVDWESDDNGKLYLPDGKLCVNLSHSGEYALCGVHNRDIGVDIQKMTECDFGIAKRFFSDSEVRYVEEFADKKEAFFEVWTKKESFVKAVGKGLTIPLNSFCVLEDCIEYDGKEYIFKEYSVKASDYKVFACCLS